MPVIVVTSSEAGAGKTTIATAIARHFAYQGTPTRLLRLAGAGRSVEDARFFGGLAFVPGSPATTVMPADVEAAEGECVVVESAISDLGALPGASVVLVARDVAPARPPDGIDPAAIVVTDVDGLRGRREQVGGDGPPVVEIGEDRTLAGFGVDEVQAMLNAEVLVEGETTGTTCDYLVIAPIGSDAGQPYFRRFDTKAVVVRFDKTDMHLAAMQADPVCLILTGGRRPSDYLFDAANAQGVPVLLSRTDTENTVIALEGIFDRTRFSGERKTERIAQLLDGSSLFARLGI